MYTHTCTYLRMRTNSQRNNSCHRTEKTIVKAGVSCMGGMISHHTDAHSMASSQKKALRAHTEGEREAESE
jgi:hypothetical protein